MPDYYIGEIAVVGFNYAPMDFMSCEGQLLSITQYQALYSLLGTMYGGDGQTTFALPNLNGRVALAAGAAPGLTSYSPGNTGGADNVTLTSGTMPGHTHTVNAATTSRAPATTPAANVPGGGGTLKPYTAAPDGTTAMNVGMLKSVGGGLAHENRQPYQCLNFVICVNGLYPPRG
jgi:microcystin-dependent protein